MLVLDMGQAQRRGLGPRALVGQWAGAGGACGEGGSTTILVTYNPVFHISDNHQISDMRSIVIGCVVLLCVVPSLCAPTALIPRPFDTDLDTTNGLAQNGENFCTPLETPLGSAPHLDGGRCEVAVAAFGESSSQLELLRVLIPMACDIIVYDKGDSPCSFMPLTGFRDCIKMPNVGREQHTWSYFVSTRYDTLPDYLFMIPADLSAHDRAHSVQLMLNSTIFNTTRPGGQARHSHCLLNPSIVRSCPVCTAVTANAPSRLLVHLPYVPSMPARRACLYIPHHQLFFTHVE